MPINVLVVDDSATIRMVVLRVLGQTGLDIDQTFQADDGQAALDILQSHRVDLILSDINMPRVDGLEMVRRLQADPKKSHIPVVIITTEGAEATLDEAMRLGARGYVKKPFTPEMLAEAIETCNLEQ